MQLHISAGNEEKIVWDCLTRYCVKREMGNFLVAFTVQIKKLENSVKVLRTN